MVLAFYLLSYFVPYLRTCIWWNTIYMLSITELTDVIDFFVTAPISDIIYIRIILIYAYVLCLLGMLALEKCVFNDTVIWFTSLCSVLS